MDKQTIKIQISCEIGVRYLIETTTKIEDIIGYDALFNSLQKCKKGVGWKSTTGYYIHNWNTELLISAIREFFFHFQKLSIPVVNIVSSC